MFALLLFLTEVAISVPDMIEVKEKDGMVEVCATLFTVENTERNIVVTLQSLDDTGLCYLIGLS